MNTLIKLVFISIFSLVYLTGYSQNAIAISQDMLASIKMNQPLEEFEKELAEMPYDSLVAELNTDGKRQTFWLNVYITYSQQALATGEQCDKKCKKAKSITVAQRTLSLNHILYSILLHSKCPITGGKKLFSPAWEKDLRVGFPDGRVLFAITGDDEIANFITYFEVAKVDAHLNEISKIYVSKHVKYMASSNVLYLPKWTRNFKREFGGKSGIYAGLRNANFIPADAEPKIIYSDDIDSL